MIQLTRLNQVPFYLNSDLIEQIEITPDTVITLTSGKKYLVLERAEQVLEQIVAFRRRITGATPASILPRMVPLELEVEE